MPQKVEATVLSSAANSPVLHLPGRQFPGVLIQGDSLKIMVDAAAEIQNLLVSGNHAEAKSCAEDLLSILHAHLKVYEDTLKSSGLKLPYAEGQG